MVVLVHLGRCGLLGSIRPAMVRHLGIPYETMRLNLDRLEELRLVTHSGYNTGQGRAHRYVVSVAGWALLCTPGDFSPFQPQEGLPLNSQDHPPAGSA